MNKRIFASFVVIIAGLVLVVFWIGINVIFGGISKEVTIYLSEVEKYEHLEQKILDEGNYGKRMELKEFRDSYSKSVVDALIKSVDKSWVGGGTGLGDSHIIWVSEHIKELSRLKIENLLDSGVVSELEGEIEYFTNYQEELTEIKKVNDKKKWGAVAVMIMAFLILLYL